MNPLDRLRSAARSVREAIPDQRRSYAPELRAAERSMEEGRYADAEASLSDLLAELDARDAVQPQHGRMLVCLAMAQLRLNKPAMARKSAQRAVAVLDGEGRKPCTDLAAAREILGRVELEEGNEERAEELLRNALETQEEVRPVDVAAIHERRCALALALERRGKTKDALALLEESLEKCEAELGEMHTVTAKCLLELGECQSRAGLHAESMRNMERALRIHQSLYGDDAEVVIRNLQLLAVAAQGAGEYESAASYYERALSLRERQLGAKSNGSVEILMDLAGVESELGRFGRAAERLQQAIGKAEVERQANLPRALEKLAVVYMLSGRLADAGRHLARARDLYDSDPQRFQKEIAANEEIYAQLRSYYRVETPSAAAKAEAAPRQTAAAGRPTAAPRVVEEQQEQRRAPEFEVFDEEEAKPAARRRSGAETANPESQAIAMLAGLLSRENDWPEGRGKDSVRVPAAEWEKLVSALQGLETMSAPVAQARPANAAAASTEPAPKAPPPLFGWEDLGFEFARA
jgi:tetratricopeptide (TPR) repeat protein